MYGFWSQWLRHQLEKGKTECLLKCRGKDATRLWKEKCHGQDVLIPLPACASSPSLHVVSEYKHLGSFVSIDGSLMPDANHRASLALNAFSPLAMKVFGSNQISVYIRMKFFETLVSSRLFYGTELWIICSSSSHAAVKRLNKVYMQVARRICDCARYGQSQCLSDLEVRKKLGISSIEVRLRKRRLMYMSRLLVHGPASLKALLAVRAGVSETDKRPPWTEQIIDDLKILKQYHYIALDALPMPDSDPYAWLNLMHDFPSAWRELIDKYVMSESVFDEAKHDRALAASKVAVGGAFSCSMCCPAVGFKSQKALDQHQRRFHNIRSEIPAYIDDSGVCPACGVHLFARAKVITHACETRFRGHAARAGLRCKDIILSGRFPRLDIDLVEGLNLRDRKLLTEARRSGHTHVRTARPAVRAKHGNAGSYRRSQICTVPTHTCNVTYDVRLPLPSKRLRVKSTLVPARPAKRLKVKTTLPCTILPTVG